MPNYQRWVEESRDEDGKLSAPWTKLPFPQSWEELERGVDEWLKAAWGPDWRCPHCQHRFWIVLEAVRLEGATMFPAQPTSEPGAYPAIPVVCAYCRQITPILALSIFNGPEKPDAKPGTPQT